MDVICCLDSVDESTVPRNVARCYNYWMPGVISSDSSNFLRGIPLVQEPGSTGQLFNYDLDREYRSWRGATTEHVTMDDDPKLQKHILDNILEVCVERSKWVPPVSPRAAASSTALSR